jgi:hypothetical protein
MIVRSTSLAARAGIDWGATVFEKIITLERQMAQGMAGGLRPAEEQSPDRER